MVHSTCMHACIQPIYSRMATTPPALDISSWCGEGYITTYAHVRYVFDLIAIDEKALWHADRAPEPHLCACNMAKPKLSPIRQVIMELGSPVWLVSSGRNKVLGERRTCGLLRWVWPFLFLALFLSCKLGLFTCIGISSIHQRESEEKTACTFPFQKEEENSIPSFLYSRRPAPVMIPRKTRPNSTRYQ